MADIDKFVEKTRKLLEMEREAEIEETKLLQESLPAIVRINFSISHNFSYLFLFG